MARPRQSEVARTAETDIDPDHVETGLHGQTPPTTGGETGPIPADNQPGHHPAKEQDKPDLDAFAAKLGARSQGPVDDQGPQAGPAQGRSGPGRAAGRRSGVAGVGPGHRRSRPAARCRRVSAPPPSTDPPQEREPVMVALAMLPLRETVKRLERLERTLSKRLMARAGRGPRGR